MFNIVSVKFGLDLNHFHGRYFLREACLKFMVNLWAYASASPTEAMRAAEIYSSARNLVVMLLMVSSDGSMAFIASSPPMGLNEGSFDSSSIEILKALFLP